MHPSDAPANRSPREIWEIVRSQLRLQMPRNTYDTWVRDTTCLASEDGAYVIGVANAYAVEWLSVRLRPLIKRTLMAVVGRAVDLTFVVHSRPLEDAPDAPQAPLLVADPTDAPGAQADETTPDGNRPATHGANLNPRHSFDHFIVGSSNRLAHAAAMAVAERPGAAYNPLFLYGGSGLGKTHLLQAVGHAVQALGKRVLYVPSELFTNELIGAIRTQTTDQFRAKYRTIDLLLLDDIQFIAGKEQTQEEFFHTFNALHSANRQLVFTSDRPPQAIPSLEERLRSRFNWGMIADVQPPNLETRVAILQAKVASLGQRVPDPVLHLIAELAHGNIRDLEGALTQVLARAQLFRQPLTVALAADALAYLEPAQGKLGLEDILQAAADYFDITVDELTGRARSARIALQRQIVMYLMREETGSSLPQVGQSLGGRDHTTIMYGCEKVANDLAGDPELRRTVNELRNRLHEPVRVRKSG